MQARFIASPKQHISGPYNCLDAVWEYTPQALGGPVSTSDIFLQQLQESQMILVVAERPLAFIAPGDDATPPACHFTSQRPRHPCENVSVIVSSH